MRDDENESNGAVDTNRQEATAEDWHHRGRVVAEWDVEHGQRVQQRVSELGGRRPEALLQTAGASGAEGEIVSKYTYSVESLIFDAKWVTLFTDSCDYCLGYLRAKQYEAPRIHLRMVRSDGHVMQDIPANADVGIGMVAGFPTAEQYEAAAERAMAQARRIRAQEAKR